MLNMVTSPVHQELQRLAAGVTRLHARCTMHRLTVEVGDVHGTSVELEFHLHGTLVRGTVRSRAGNANFELSTAGRRIGFRHPTTGRLGELSATCLRPASARALNEGVSDVQVAAKVARIARRLVHLSVLRRVEIGLREQRETLLSLPLAS